MTTDTDKLDAIETDIMRLSEQLPDQPDDILLALGRLDEVMRFAREWKAKAEAAMVQWLEAHGGRLESGEWVYWVGPTKKIKCRSVPKTLQTLMELSGGDWDAVCDCLSSNAIKYGAAKKVLGAAFDDHFETVVEQGLESKQLQSVNTRFLK